MISLVPEDTIERVSVEELVKDETLDEETPITIVREVEQTETAVPEKLIAESGGDLDTKLHVLVKYDDTVGATEGQDVATQDPPEQDVATQDPPEQDVAKKDPPEQDVATQDPPEQDVAKQDPSEQDVAKQDPPEQDVAKQDPPEQDVATQDLPEQDVSKQVPPEQDVAKQDAPERSPEKQDVAEQDVVAPDEDHPESTEQVALGRDAVEQTTVREVLERLRTEPKTPIMLVRKVRFFEVMTLRELLDTGIGTDAFLDVVRQPYRIESATLADLLQRKQAENPDTIFYVHTVQPTDDQGIWGIVQFGLIENFAGGVAIRRGEEIETYMVEIPRDADERLADQSSSFLGLMIDRKTKDSYVYNYRENRMGRNPDRIYPGQEIVIINFEPGELESIYEHFASG